MKKSNVEKNAIILRIEKEKEEYLRRLARKRSSKEDKDYNIQNLIMECVDERYFKNKK